MIEIYAPWSKGLANDKKALELLFQSQHIDGIELGNINNDIELIIDSGLKISAHTPGLYKTLNLGNKRYMDIFKTPEGQRILDIIHISDAPTVGFHLGYSAENVFKMSSFPNIPHPNSLITDRKMLMDRLINNIIELEKKINFMTPEKNQKILLIETLDYCQKVPIPWEEQTSEAIENKRKIESVISNYGLNASLLYLTDYDFVSEIMEKLNQNSIRPIGFLFDIAHNYISANTKINNSEFLGSHKDYFLQMINAVKGKTHQIHINVPGGDENKGYNDSHLPFISHDQLSNKILNLADLVVKNSPSLKVLTIEVRTHLDPMSHAKIIIEQAAYLIKHLNLPRE